MRLFFTGLSFALLLGAVEAFGAPAPDKISDALREDFERGELNSWESYPIAEDPGFDPEIWCVREPAYGGSGYSLCKVTEPEDTDWPRNEHLVGMTRKFRLWTNASTEMRLAVFADGDRKPEELRVTLYAEDGRRYVWSQADPAANGWVTLRIPRDDFRAEGSPMPAGVRLDAVSVLVRYGPVNPHRSYSLCLDDVLLTGERLRRFEVREPAATYLDKFHSAVLNRHYHRGDALALKVRPEEGGKPVELASLTATALDPSGRERARQVKLTPTGDGFWTTPAIHRFGDTDPSGQWSVVLEGRGTAGERVEETIRFLVPARRFTPADHPRLFFTGAELDSLKSGTMDPKRKKVLDAAVESARKTLAASNVDAIVESKGGNREFLDGGPVSATWDWFYRWHNTGAAMRETVTAGAFLYAFTGDREAGLTAKAAMLKFAGFDEWIHPWFLARHMYTYYPVGLWMYAMGVGYDLLYPLLTPEERTLIRTKVMEKAVIPHYRDWVENNRKPSNITNHIGMNSTGMLVAALAFLGEDPEQPDLEPYLSGILAKYKAHIDAAYRPDGSYAEPEAYAGTDTEHLTICLDALERNLGIDWTSTTPVKDTYRYQLHLSTAEGLNCPAFGDGGRSWGFSLRNLHLWLAHRMKDPSALERYRWQTEGGVFSPRYTFFDFLWYPDPELKPMPLSQHEPSRWFWSKGNAVLRSGWEKDALIFALKCGPHSNHYHLDQGTFWLLYNGETLLSEAGVVNYYTNLYYKQFYMQPVSHNTLLLNGYPESQRIADLDDEVSARNEFPRIRSCFTGRTLDAVEGELSCVYKGRLSEYSRSFVYLKSPGYMVLFDRVAAGEPERFTWAFNTEGKNTFQGTGNTVRVTRPKADLRMEVLSPSGLERKVRPHPDRDGSTILLAAPEPDRNGAFLAVMIPSREDNRADHEAWTTVRADEPGWTGAEIRRADETDRVFFRSDGGEGVRSAGRWETDGDRLALTELSDGSPRLIWVRNAALLRGADGGELFRSDRRLTLLADYSGNTPVIETDSEAATELSLRSARTPAAVLLDGARVKHRYDRKSGTVRIALPEGRHVIEVW